MAKSLQSGTKYSNILFRESNSLRKAKLRAARQWKFCRNAIFSMRSVPVIGLGTMGVDKHWRLAYDPVFVEEQAEGVLACIILHELLHLLNEHHQRFEDEASNPEDPEQQLHWNIAADFSINHMLAEEFNSWPSDYEPHAARHSDYIWITDDFIQYHDPEFNKYKIKRDQETESHYRMIRAWEESNAENTNDKQTNQGEVSTDRGGIQRESIGTSSVNEQSDGYVRQGQGNAGGHQSDEGNGRNPNPSDYEHQSGDSSSNADDGQSPARDVHDDPTDEQLTTTESGELQWNGTPADRPGTGGVQVDLSKYLPSPDDDPDAPGLSRSEVQSVLRDTAYRCEHSTEHIPVAFKSWVSGIINIKVDPWQVINRMITRTANNIREGNKRTYRRKSRRSEATGMMLPTRYGQEPEIAICLDTSGSMNEDDFKLAKGLISKIFKKFKSQNTIDIYMGDTSLQDEFKMTKKIEDIPVTGGGGTDVGQLLEDAIQERAKQPDIIIAVTDGYTPWPETALKVPVLVALTQDVTDYYPVPSWATTLDLRG